MRPQPLRGKTHSHEHGKDYTLERVHFDRDIRSAVMWLIKEIAPCKKDCYDCDERREKIIKAFKDVCEGMEDG